MNKVDKLKSLVEDTLVYGEITNFGSIKVGDTITEIPVDKEGGTVTVEVLEIKGNGPLNQLDCIVNVISSTSPSFPTGKYLWRGEAEFIPLKD